MAQPLIEDGCPPEGCPTDPTVVDQVMDGVDVIGDVSSEGATTEPTTDIDTGGLVPCSGIECNMCSAISLIERIINWLIGIMLVVFAGITAWAGFKLVTSGGNPEAKTAAKSLLTNAFIGIVIVLTAWLLIDTLMRAILPSGTGELEGGPWNSVECYPAVAPASVSTSPTTPIPPASVSPENIQPAATPSAQQQTALATLQRNDFDPDNLSDRATRNLAEEVWRAATPAPIRTNFTSAQLENFGQIIHRDPTAFTTDPRAEQTWQTAWLAGELPYEGAYAYDFGDPRGYLEEVLGVGGGDDIASNEGVDNNNGGGFASGNTNGIGGGGSTGSSWRTLAVTSWDGSSEAIAYGGRVYPGGGVVTISEGPNLQGIETWVFDFSADGNNLTQMKSECEADLPCGGAFITQSQPESLGMVPTDIRCISGVWNANTNSCLLSKNELGTNGAPPGFRGATGNRVYDEDDCINPYAIRELVEEAGFNYEECQRQYDLKYNSSGVIDLSNAEIDARSSDGDQKYFTPEQVKMICEIDMQRSGRQADFSYEAATDELRAVWVKEGIFNDVNRTCEI
jgi:DNA-binding transcriptional MerR regulator